MLRARQAVKVMQNTILRSGVYRRNRMQGVQQDRGVWSDTGADDNEDTTQRQALQVVLQV